MRHIILCLLLLSGSPCLRAEDVASTPDISIKGFGTMGFVHNSTSGAEFARNVLQPHGVADGWSGKLDSRFGLQLNADLNNEWDVVVQAVSKYNHEGNYSPELTWAFVSYAPKPDLIFRGGRVGWDVYMLADSRDVGYSYPWVRPPVEYFGFLILSHLDGGDAVYKQPLAGGLVSAKIYGGLIDQKIPVTGGPAFDGSGSTIVGGNLDFWKGDWFFRGGYASIHIDNEFQALVPLIAALRGIGSSTTVDLAEDLGFAGSTVEIASLGGIWEHGSWQAQLMYAHFSSDSLFMATSNSGYLSLGYRRGKWSPYFTVAGVDTDSAEAATGLPLPNPLDSALGLVLGATQRKQHTFSLGLRYDFMPNADVKMQVDRTHVYDHATALWRVPRADWDGDATLVTIVLDFVF